MRRAGDDPPHDVLHALRIQGKRLRYTGELVADAGRKPVRKLVESTVALQDVLGEHQDACVAQQKVRHLLSDLGDGIDFDVVFAAGRLVEREEVNRMATRQAWPAAWEQVQHRAQLLILNLNDVTTVLDRTRQFMRVTHDELRRQSNARLHTSILLTLGLQSLVRLKLSPRSPR